MASCTVIGKGAVSYVLIFMLTNRAHLHVTVVISTVLELDLFGKLTKNGLRRHDIIDPSNLPPMANDYRKAACRAAF